MPVYTLSYFGVKAFADCARLILNHANVDFTDEHITKGWDQRKEKTPFGKVPILTLSNGDQIAESIAMSRYLGKTHGLAGANDRDEAKLDAIVYATKDLVSGEMNDFFSNAKTDAEKIEHVKTRRGALAERYRFINKQLAASKSGFILDNVKWADFVLFGYWNILRNLLSTDLSPVPGIKRHYDTVNGLPSVKAFMKKTENVPVFPFKTYKVD